MPVDAILASTSDSVIIQDELDELDREAAAGESRKRDLVLAAAEKLAPKYADEPTKVGRRLLALIARDRRIVLDDGTERTVFARVSRGWLYAVLPPKYTREYDPDVDDDKDEDGEYPDEEEEQDEAGRQFQDYLDAGAQALEHAAAAMQEHAAQYDEMRRGGRAERAAAAELSAEYARTARMSADKLADHLAADAREALAGLQCMTDAPSAYVRRTEADWAACRKLADRRIKFSTATRLLLRMIFQFRHYGDVAGKINHAKRYGAKWLSNIDRDETLAQFVDLVSCPNCQFDFELWMERAKERATRGLEIPPIDDKFCRKK